MAHGAGNYIDINHGGGWHTYYFHLAAYSVDDGAYVAQGQQVGVTGTTGNSTGEHIHYEQLYNGAGQTIVIDGASLAPYPGAYGVKSITSTVQYFAKDTLGIEHIPSREAVLALAAAGPALTEAHLSAVFGPVTADLAAGVAAARAFAD